MLNFIGSAIQRVILVSLSLSFTLYAVSSFGVVDGNLKLIIDFSTILIGSVSALGLIYTNKHHKDPDSEIEVISA